MWSRVTRGWTVLPVAVLGLLLVACPAKQSPSLPAPPSPATGSPSPPAPSASPSEPSSAKPEDPAEPQGESSNAKKEDQGTDQGDAAAAEKGDSEEERSESASTTGDAADTKQKHATGAKGDAAKSGIASKPGGAKTAGAHRAQLEGELAGSLREFDEMLLKEQEELQRRRAEAGGELDPAGIATGGGNGTGAASAAGEGAQGSTNPGTAPGGSSGGTHAAGAGAAPAPKGVPDGNDDDVVARQIREAALKEKDPALRARLWVEYCDYKKSTGGKQCTLPAGEGAAPEKDGEDHED